MKKMILLQIEFAEKEIRETENKLNAFFIRKEYYGLISEKVTALISQINFFKGYKEAMQICLRELEERENSELEKMYEEQKNNL